MVNVETMQLLQPLQFAPAASQQEERNYGIGGLRSPLVIVSHAISEFV